MRKAFFEKLEKLARIKKDVFLLTADLGVKFFQNFKNIDPERFINVGVAESNMIGMAAGLAMSGKNPYCYSIIPFLTMRTFEQIRVDLCYNNLDVKLLGSGGGLVYGAEGITHHAIEDIAIMRSLPNMTVVAPGDAKEAEALAEISVSHKGPLFIRFGRDSDPIIHKGKIKFQIGKGIIIEKGKDVCLIATGSMVFIAKKVSEILKEKGIGAALISMHTIKPLDAALVRNCAKNYKFIFSLEEHSILGGLGGAIAEVLSESGYCGRFKRIGIKDEYSFPDMGDVDYLRKKAGLDPDSISKTILKSFNKK
jgi:transketolase